MALQNRVDPWGDLVATGARGTLMGNRGGQLHDEDRRIVRDQRSRAWITCQLEFKGRRREVMAPRQYTELFFLDEATALAAGHRPCFECRRDDARRFLELWRRGRTTTTSLHDLDAALSDDRRVPRARLGTGKRAHPDRLGDLPDGAMVDLDGHAWLVASGRMLRWSFDGYDDVRDLAPDTAVWVLTPRTTVQVLRAGYASRLHATAWARLDEPPTPESET